MLSAIAASRAVISRRTDTAGGLPAHPGSRTGLLAVADGNRYADLTSGACRASAGYGREQTMTVMRTTGHNCKDSIPSFPAHLPHLKSPDAATAVARAPR